VKESGANFAWRTAKAAVPGGFAGYSCCRTSSITALPPLSTNDYFVDGGVAAHGNVYDEVAGVEHKVDGRIFFQHVLIDGDLCALGLGLDADRAHTLRVFSAEELHLHLAAMKGAQIPRGHGLCVLKRVILEGVPLNQPSRLLESRLRSRLDSWKHDSCPASFPVTQIQELNRAAVGFGDLPGKH